MGVVVDRLLDKAHRAQASANRLLAANDFDGAVSRAYYAMLFGARWALAVGAPTQDPPKRHASVIRNFSRILILQHGIDATNGRALNIAMTERLIADYEPETVEAGSAQAVLADMARFLVAIERLQRGDQRR